MSVSSDGILCYGVDLGEDVGHLPWAPDDEDHEMDFDGWLVELAGGSPRAEAWARYEAWAAEYAPDLGYPQSMNAWEAADLEGRDALSEGYRVEREIVAASPIEVVLHCSYDYPMYIIAVRGSEVRASRGYPKKVDIRGVPAGAAAALAFCAEHAIQYDDPGWILTSVYG